MADNNLTTKEEFLLNPVEEHNITDAAVASFETNLKHPLKVTVPIAPIQDLHGMPNPYPAGASVNLIPDTTDTENGYVAGQYLNEDGTTIANANFYISEYFNVDPSTTYTWSSRDSNSDAPCIWFYDENKNLISGIRAEKQLPKTFNPPEGAVYCRSSQTTYTHQEANPSSTAAYQLEVGSTATAYRRYSNICPIEGLDECRFLSDPKRAGFIAWNQRAGLRNNLWGHHNTTTTFDGTKIIITATTGAGLKQTWVNFPVNHKIIFKGTIKKESTADGVYIGIYKPGDTGNNQRVYVAVTEEDVQFSRLLTSSGSITAPTLCLSTAIPRNATLIVDKVQLFDLTEMFGAGNEPATVAAFNALFPNDYYEYNYREETCISAVNGDPHSIIPITFTDPSTGDPMTVYGGSLTLNEDGSADLVSDKAIIDMGSLDYTYDGVYTRMMSGTIYDMKIADGAREIEVICDMFQTIGNKMPIADVPNESIYTGAKQRCYYVKTALYTDPVVFKSTVAGHKVIYPLANSQTYHFPNVGQLKAFLGQNNVWSDIGNVNVKYLTQHSETGLEYRGDRALELRRRAMMADAPKVKTAVGSDETGGLASFKSYVKAPVKKIEIPFSPKQDLHGYDHPWPAGGGKNLANSQTGYDSSGGTVTTTTINTTTNPVISSLIKVDPSTQYTLSRQTGGGVFRCFYFDTEPVIGETVSIGGQYCNAGVTSVAVTTHEDAAWMFIVWTRDNENTPCGNVQVEKGSTPTAWTPYENICPIEGYDGCEISKTGKNLFDKSKVIRGYYMGAYGTPGSSLAFGYALVHVGGLSSVRISGNKAENTAARYIAFDAEGTPLISPQAARAKGDKTITLPAGSKTLSVNVYISGANMDIDTVQVEAGSEASAYENFGTIIPLIFNQSGDHEIMPIQDGTGDPSPVNIRPLHQGLTFTRDDDSVLSIYGGTLTVNADGSSELVSKFFRYELNGNSGLTDGSGYNKTNSTNRYVIVNSMKSMSYAENKIAYSDRLCVRNGAIWAYDTAQNFNAFNTNIKQLHINFKNEDFGINSSDAPTTRSSILKAYLTDNPIEFILEQETPTTYTLSVTETNRALEALGLTQHIGPLYGGTITINPDGSADVVSEYAIYDLGSLNWVKDTAGGNEHLFRVDIPQIPVDSTADVGMCSCVESIGFWNIGTWRGGYSHVKNKIGVSWSSTGETRYIYIKPMNISTVSDLASMLADQTFAYKMATPQTYHFSNLEQLKVWLGENNFWCDISDDITVKYWNRG